MLELEIQRASGDVERRRLSRSQPLSVGRHRTSDVWIDEDGVAVLHCRISWNGRAFEVAAANPAGVDLNGTLVRNAPLAPGDVLRVGSVDLTVVQEGAPPRRGERALAAAVSVAHAESSSEVELKPESVEEVAIPRRPAFVPPPPAGERDAAGSAAPSAPDDLLRDVDYSAAKLNRETVSRETVPARDRSRGRNQASRWRRKPVRPGEQDPLRSPLVLGLAIGSAVLVLAALVFWLMIGRQSAQQAYEAAVADMGEGKYTQAIARFEKFLNEYPRHDLSAAAQTGLGKARIEQQISGSAASWPHGLSELQNFIDANRDRPDFATLQDDVARFGERIALGAVAAAQSSRQRELLGTATEAAAVVARYSPSEKQRTAYEQKFRTALRTGEAAVLKQEVFGAALKEIETAVAARRPAEALAARQRLLTRYPELGSERRLSELLDRTLSTEAALVQREEPDRDGVAEDHPASLPAPLSLTLHTRTRTDEPAGDRTVFAVAKDCLYGIETVTGDPRWRRVIGSETPFFPVSVATAVPGILALDSNRAELLLLESRTGRLVWRQPIGERISGAPLVLESQIYLPTLDGRMYQLDLETGRIAARLQFSQRLLGPPVATPDGNRLIVAGDGGLLYTLARRPLACESASYLGHRAGSIAAPLTVMGSLLLVCENDRQESCRLRVLDLRPGRTWLAEVDSTRIEGQVRNPPVLRGRQLFVTSSPERIAAFTVTDEPEQPPLALVASHQVPNALPGAMYLSAGPDGQLWMAGSALRRFQLTTDSIRADANQLAAGLTAQPLQQLGSNLFAGRSALFHTAVTLTQVDRDAMAGQWRTVLGATVLDVVGAGGESLTVLTESGDLYRIASRDLERGGFLEDAVSLKLPETLAQPLRAARLSAEHSAVWTDGAEPSLSIVGASGEVERTLPLDQPLETAPARIAAGIVLPLPGRLRLVRADGTAKTEDYLMPAGPDEVHAWKHVVALDDDDVAALDGAGRLVRVQYRESPLPHLAAVVQRVLDAPVDVPPAMHAAGLLLADAGGRLQLLDPSSLEVLAECALPAAASGPPWLAGDRVYVQAGPDRLTAVDVGAELQPVWTIPVGKSGPAGAPLVEGDVLVVAGRGGEVLAVEHETGAVRRTLSVGQPLTTGPVRAGPQIVVASVDGSWHRIESVLTEE